ncbi:MAG TPA: hypothetical protein PKW95_18730 [bacterium]|nr:hypothetical protein [bacterium]
MNRLRWILSLSVTALLLFAFAATAVAESFVVYQPQVEGYDEGTARIIGQLLVAELENIENTSAAYVTGPEACRDKACARKAVDNNLVDAAIISHLFKLGTKAIYTLDVVRSTETTAYRVSADGVGEFDRLMGRLARAIVEKKSFEDAMTVTSVSEAEATAHKRIKGDFSWGPGIGMLVPIADSYGGADFIFGVLVPFRYEIEKWGFEFETGVLFDDQSDEYHRVSEIPLDFTAMYFFSEGIGSPFVGGTVGLHYLAVKSELTEEEEMENRQDIWAGRARSIVTGSDSYTVDRETDDTWNLWGPSVGVFGGYEFLRTHSFHVDARLGYRFTFIKLDDNWAHGPFMAVHFTFGHNK